MARIVVADDDPITLIFLRTLLEDRGHVVMTAEDGADALTLVRSEMPDLLVTDLVMPFRSGLEIIREIRARRDRRRRDVLEPRILSLVNGGPRAEHSVGLPNPFLTEFGPATVPSERRVREAILTDHALRLQGTSRERISMAFEEFGYV